MYIVTVFFPKFEIILCRSELDGTVAFLVESRHSLRPVHLNRHPSRALCISSKSKHITRSNANNVFG